MADSVPSRTGRTAVERGLDFVRAYGRSGPLREESNFYRFSIPPRLREPRHFVEGFDYEAAEIAIARALSEDTIADYCTKDAELTMALFKRLEQTVVDADPDAVIPVELLETMPLPLIQE